MSKNENKVLDDLKKIDEQVKQKTLARMLTSLKEKAKEIHEIKYYTNKLLSELWINDKDSKAIIDWINSLNDVQLSDEQKKQIDKDIKSEIKDEKVKVEKKYIDNNFYYSNTTWLVNNHNVLVTTTASTDKNLALNWMTLTNNSNTWEVLC